MRLKGNEEDKKTRGIGKGSVEREEGKYRPL